MTEKTLKTAFVFAGGGSLGAVQVGMLKALIAAGSRADFLVGASAGAINAVHFAAEPSATGLERLAQVWNGLRRGEVFPIRALGGILGLFSRRNYLIDTRDLRTVLESHLFVRNFEETKIPCHIVATEFSGGSEIRLSNGSIVDALLASTALPALFPPVLLHGKTLVDGGIANNTPVSTAFELGAERVGVQLYVFLRFELSEISG